MYIYQSYTYLIGWSSYNKWYYGVRFGNKCCPEEDLWIRYFTSSKYVKDFKKIYGNPDVIQVRKKFNNSQDAIRWEEKVLSKLDVLKNDKWLNRNIRGAIQPMIGNQHPRFGKQTTQDVKNKISNKNKGKVAWNKGIPRSVETIEKIKNSIGNSRKGSQNSMYGKKHSEETIKKIKLKVNNRGSNNPMYGKNHSEETKKILSEKNKGENSSSFIGYYKTPWGEFSSSVEAALNSPVSISSWTVNRWCRNENQKIISKKSVSKSKFLSEEHVGKSFYNIGFSFTPSMAFT
jgi:hypothetical protein